MKSNIDGGWAWVVLAACFCMNILNAGYIKCFGILFVEVEKEFKTTASVTSLLMGVNAAFSSITALIVLNYVLERVSLRKTTLAGVVTLSTGVLINSFATNVYVLIFSQGILAGSGAAMLYGPGLVHVSKYFKKRRAMATAICSCGVSTGGMLLPPFVQYLISEYGLRGAFLLMSGMMLQILVFVSLYRPLQKGNVCSNSPSKDVDDVISNDSLNDEDEGALMNYDDVTSKDVTKRFDEISTNQSVRSYRNVGSKDAVTIHNVEGSMDVMKSVVDDKEINDGKDDVGNQRISAEEKSSMEENDIKYNAIQKKIESHPMLPESLQLNKPKESPKPSLFITCLQNLNFSFFRRPLYLLIFGFTACGFLGVGLFQTFLPPLAQEKGLTSTQAAVLLTMFNGLELVSRLISSFLAEVSFVKTHHLITLSMLLLGTLNQLTKFFNSFVLMASYVAVFGVLNGFYPALHPAVIINFVGIDNFPKVFGFVQVFHGAMMTACYPLMGALRDLTGSYSASFHFLGACKLMSAIFLVLLPLAKRAEQHQQQ